MAFQTSHNATLFFFLTDAHLETQVECRADLSGVSSPKSMRPVGRGCKWVIPGLSWPADVEKLKT